MDRFGPYRVLSRLGAGGMGVAYRATGASGRDVVVKVLRPDVAAEPTARTRLAREVETMRRVRSPYVAQMLDADLDGAEPYVVTEYVPGPSLREHVERHGPLRGEVLVRFACGLAEALWAIHRAGIVHRDLTPNNVLVAGGEPVVIDFGIARAVDLTRLTHTGAILGTPGYLSTELLDGDAVGPPADVFALAATLIYAATGRHPFGSGPVEAIHYRIFCAKADLTDVPPALRGLLTRALAPAAADRPTTAELRDAFRRLDPDRLDRQDVPVTDPSSAAADAASEEPTAAPGERRDAVSAAEATATATAPVPGDAVEWRDIGWSAGFTVLPTLLVGLLPTWVWLPWGIVCGSVVTLAWLGRTAEQNRLRYRTLSVVFAVLAASLVIWIGAALFWLVRAVW